MNTATVTGDYADQTVTASNPAYWVGVEAPVLAIDVLKDVSPDNGVTWYPADTPPGPNVVEGTNPQFRFTVINTGNVTLNNVIIIDDVLGLIGIIPDIVPGASAQWIVIGAWFSGQQKNTVTATGVFEGQTVTVIDPAYYFGVGVVPTESVCIVTEKVYASCQQRECFLSFHVPLPAGFDFIFQDISFGNGSLVAEPTLSLLPSRPNFARFQFGVRIPYNLRLLDSHGKPIEITGYLPDIDKDIIFYYPKIRPETELNLRIETRSELLAAPVFTDQSVQLAIGMFLIFKVTAPVQLLIPAMGYCPEPDECQEFTLPIAISCTIF